MVPTPNEARAMLGKHNEEPFHLQHAEAVGAVLAYVASKHGHDAEYWRAVGLLHDIDFERCPEEHCVRGEELLRNEGVDEAMIASAMSHGCGQTATPHEPSHFMEQVLYAADELTGLVFAVSLMRPSKSVMDLEVPSVMKKFKDKRFAAGCSRDTIRQGAERLGWPLEELIAHVIAGMREYERENN